MRIRVLLILTALSLNSFSAGKLVNDPYASSFNLAYQQYPKIPRGLLEAVAFAQSRFYHLSVNDQPSCVGLPGAYTVFGLVEDGKGVFRNNLLSVSQLSGKNIADIKNDPAAAILSYAHALSAQQMMIRGPHTNLYIAEFPWLSRIGMLSELPPRRDFAYDSFLYEVVKFLNDPEQAALHGFSVLNWDEEKIFGKENLRILKSPNIVADKNGVKTPDGSMYKTGPEVQSPDYGPALWTPAGSCNYSNGRSQSVSAVTIHTVQGSYAGCISWFQNCAASVSAHYVVRSSDGQITQMVLESNTAWHVGNQNAYTVGIEHEGYVSQSSWYTTAMYTSSAALTADICSSNGIDPLRTGWWPWLPTTYYNQSSIPGACTRVKGHMHYPSQTHTDPGQYWDWNYYYQLINPAPAATVFTTGSGNFYDSGGPAGDYADDERYVWTIAPTNASSVTLNFSSFDLESTWDYLFIYDGNSTSAPLIGLYTGTNSPGAVTGSGGSLTVEFRSDCSTPATGWNATWSSTGSAAPSNLSVQQSNCPSLGVDLSWMNTGTGWFVDISPDPNFTVFYNKNVSSLTSTSCPGSFCEYPSCNSYLKFEPNTTYYWRIWDGNTQTYGTPFTTPVCAGTDNNCMGSVDDSGGPSNAYGSNEDYTFTIAPPNASSITISFSAFDLETGFDSLYIHDGPDATAPLLGSWTGTNSPGTLTSSGGTLTLHFISDPLVNNAGFSANWTCSQLTSTPDIFSQAFSIYPVPCTTQSGFTIYSSGSGEFHFSLMDLAGRSVLEENLLLTKGENLIPGAKLELLKPGAYLVRISNTYGSFELPILFR